MDGINKTLYIPLYGKAFVSRKGIILADPKAEEIWQAEQFPLKGKAASRWLSYYMGMRSRVFDRKLEELLEENPTAAVLHLGCGMDSRVLRVNHGGKSWYDVDFPEVIAERSRYFSRQEGYSMLPADLREQHWLEQIPAGGSAVVIMEGVSMYLTRQELLGLLSAITERFDRLSVVMDCYTEFAAKATRYQNPINEVGVTRVYGLDDPGVLEQGTGLAFLCELEMTPEELIRQLSGWERAVFRRLFAGSVAKKMYRMYEFQKK